jgi:flavin reductase (DIM6/NTAB) family NADH-FMN oxidoreductase RutF
MKKDIWGLVEKIVYVVQPSPVVLVSSISLDNIKNLAPFATFMVSSSNPPMIALGISPKSDTFKNIKETEEYVVGIPYMKHINNLYKAGTKYAPEEDEFELCGFSSYSSKIIKPFRIKECAVNIECKLLWMKESGHHYLINGEVVNVDIDENLFSNDKIQLRTNIPKVYHITSNIFNDGCNNILAEK